MSLNVNTIYGNDVKMNAFAAANTAASSQATTVNKQNATNTVAPSVSAQNVLPAYQVRTNLVSKEDKEKFYTINSMLGKQEKKALQLLLSSGRLLDDKSNDKSTTLDNLYKIVTTKRADGLDVQNILNEMVTTLINPFVITQKFGDIPKPLANKVLAEGLNGKAISENKSLKQVVSEQIEMQKKQSQTPAISNITPLSDEHTPDIMNEKTINVDHSGCCVAASIEFNFAKQYPAEFARFVEGLTSPKVAVNKTIETKNLNDKTLDSVWLLNAFKIPYKMNDFKSANIVLAPDKNAILRAQIQNSYKDPQERSLVDVLMQSTFMNVGSQQTYNSLTDVNQSEMNQNDRGLGEFEKTFVESVVEDKNTTSVTFQNIDDDGKLTGYAFSNEKMLKHIVDSLSTGNSVIIGYTDFDNNKKLVNGHEITIIGFTKDKQGKLNFICNDTDDNYSGPVFYPVDEFLPKIHHAGLPAEVLKDEPQEPESWKTTLQGFQDELKTQRQNGQAPQPQPLQQSGQPMATAPQTVAPVILYNGVPYTYAPNMYQEPIVQQSIYNQAQQSQYQPQYQTQQPVYPQQIYSQFPQRG